MTNFIKTSAVALVLSAGLTSTTAAYADAATGEARAVQLEELATVDLQITGTTNFGTSMADILTGTVTPPPSGARINVAFEGTATGPLGGTMSGVDYLNIRADGRIELNVHATIVTPDGAQISYEAGGVSVAQPDGIGILRETVKLTTTAPDYAWVNGHTFIAEGTVDTNTGEIDLVLFK